MLNSLNSKLLLLIGSIFCLFGLKNKERVGALYQLAGHTAKNLCYFLMELVSGYILDIEVKGKQHVGLASSNREKQALQNALQHLQAPLNIVEVVTDASSTITKVRNVTLGQRKKFKSTFPVGHQITLAPTTFLQ